MIGLQLRKGFPSPLPRQEGLEGTHQASPSHSPVVTPSPGRGTNMITGDRLSH